MKKEKNIPTYYLPSPYKKNFWGLYHQYLIQEQQLHVKTGDHFWRETFGITGLDSRYEPEKNIQFALPIIVLPLNRCVIYNEYPFLNLELNQVHIPIHPSYLVNEKFLTYLIENNYNIIQDSKYIATPTSSYRTLGVIKVKDGSDLKNLTITDYDDTFTPCQVKCGAFGVVLGGNRDLWHEETFQSIWVSKYADSIEEDDFKRCELSFLKESSGASLKVTQKVIDNPSFIPINCLIRDFPNKRELELFEYYGFSALISTLTKDYVPVIRPIHGGSLGLGKNLPIGYRLASNFIKKYKIKDLKEGLQKWFDDIIMRFTNAASIYLKYGLTFEPHSQNLGVIVKNGLIFKFFIRDGGGFSYIKCPTNVNGLNSSHFPDKMFKDIQEQMITIEKNFNKNVILSMSLFFSFYVINKLCKIFIKDDTYERLGIEGAISEPKYSIMSLTVTPLQSGNIERRVGKSGPGTSRLDPIPPLHSKQSRVLYLSQSDIDNIRVSIKTHWTDNIIKNIGKDIPDDCYDSLQEFKAVEKRAEQYTTQDVTMKEGDFAKWILSKGFNYPSNINLSILTITNFDSLSVNVRPGAGFHANQRQQGKKDDSAMARPEARKGAGGGNRRQQQQMGRQRRPQRQQWPGGSAKKTRKTNRRNKSRKYRKKNYSRKRKRISKKYVKRPLTINRKPKKY